VKDKEVIARSGMTYLTQIEPRLIATRSEHATEALTRISEGGAFRTAIPDTILMGNNKGSPKGKASESPGNATLSGANKKSGAMNPTPQQLWSANLYS
jgi:hypothetical protein